MAIILPAAAMKARKQRRALRPTKADRRARVNYYNALADQVRYLKGQTANLSDILKSGAERSTVARTLADMTAEARARAALYAPQIAQKFVGDVDRGQKAALEASISKALGVDFARIMDEPQISADLSMAMDRNVALIKSISDEHLFKVASAVMDNYSGVQLPDAQSLVERLRDLGAQTDNRARLIARDQTSKLTGVLNQSRQQSNGIESYIWRTSKDSRVVGTPGGKFPTPTDRHGNHYKREGEEFQWSDPPADGNPGHPIQCRCWAEPILDLDKLKALYA